jgi:hypothetical protein
MRLCVVPLISDFSGDLWASGMGLTVYELAGAAALSRAFSSSALAACMMRADVFGRNVRFGEPGFKGSGGGARSGSELSHLKWHVSLCLPHIYTEMPRDGRRTLGCWKKNVCGGQVPDRGSLPCRWMALCGVKDAGGDDSTQNSGVGMHSGKVNWARVNCTVRYGAGGR